MSYNPDKDSLRELKTAIRYVTREQVGIIRKLYHEAGDAKVALASFHDKLSVVLDELAESTAALKRLLDKEVAGVAALADAVTKSLDEIEAYQIKIAAGENFTLPAPADDAEM